MLLGATPDVLDARRDGVLFVVSLSLMTFMFCGWLGDKVSCILRILSRFVAVSEDLAWRLEL